MIILDSDERILLKVRKHWIILLSETAFLLFFLALPFLLYAVINFLNISQTLIITGNMLALAIFLLGAWLLLVWVSFFIIWTDYYLDMLIVTDKHIIDIEQKGPFSRELSTFRLDRVQDITSEMDGIIETFFNYGTIHIQTAGEDREFIMAGIPAPFEMKQFITKHHDTAIERLRTVNISDDSLHKISNQTSD